ncbi:MAG: SBBP repeat-containing protein [Bacteroidia bacterium]
MKKKLLSLGLLFISAIPVFAQINMQWQARYTSGGTGSIIEQAKDIAMDASGNVYVCGTGNGAGNTFDYVVVKYSSSGSQQWVQYYDGAGAGYDDCRAVAVDASGNVIITGWSDAGAGNYNAVTVKYNSAGVQQWVASYNGPAGGNDEASDVCTDAAGKIYVVGAADNTGGKGVDYVLLVYNAGGGAPAITKLYDKNLLTDQAKKVAVDGSGNIYVTGQGTNSTGNGFDIITNKYTSAGTLSWSNSYNNSVGTGDDFPKDMVINTSGEVFITGYTLASGVIDYDAITFKIPSTGTSQSWVKTVAGTLGDQDQGNAIALDPSGNVLVTGKVYNTSTAQDMLTVKYDPAGTLLWQKVFNGAANNLDEGYGITADAAGDVYVTGVSYVAGQSNNYHTRKYLGATGTVDWITQYNGTGNNSDIAIGVFVDANLNVFVSGTSRGSGTSDDLETIKYCQLRSDAGTDTSICLGGTATLTASAPNALLYLWTDTLGNNLGGSATINVNPGAPMKYIVTVTNTLGCVDLDTVFVSINQAVVPVISASPSASVCIGDTITLTSNAYSAYAWSTSDNTQSTQVTSTGTYSVTVTDTNTCQATGSISVTVHGLPNVSAGLDTGVCSSNTLVLCASGAQTYSWSDGPLFTINDTTIACPTISPTSATDYILKGTDAFGCINYDTVNVVIYSLPPLPGIMNGPVLTATSSVPVAAYQWYDYNCSTNASSPIAGANSVNYTITVSSCYVVEITDTNGCRSSSSPVIVTVGINEGPFTAYSVYPNPAGNNVTIQYPAASTEKIQLSIYNVTGEKVMSNSLLFSAGSDKQSLDLSALPPGVYMMELINGKGERSVRRLLKE